MIRLALFDVDGTLLDSGGAGRRALLQAVTEMVGLPIGESAGTVGFAGRTDPAILRSLLEALRLDRSSPDLIERIFERYLVHLDSELTPPGVGHLHPGVRELLEGLAEDPEFRVGLLTGNIEAGARVKLARFGILSFFRFGAYGSDAEDRDLLVPIARARASALERSDLAEAPAVVIGDTPLDIRCARAGRARSLAVATGFAASSDLAAEGPDALLPSLSDTREVLALLRRLTELPPAGHATPRRDP